jgi:hypothetical protein
MENFRGGWREMREALIRAGYGPSDLRQCFARGVGPPSQRICGRRVYQWQEVEAWARTRKRPHKIDLGPSALGRWLKPRETAWGFAFRLNVPVRYVHRLIGHRTSLWFERLPPPDVMELISLETGIPLARLEADAMDLAC